MNGAIATGCPADKKEVIITAEQDHVTKITEDNPDAFWDLIHQAKTACGQDIKAMEHFLMDRLISMGPESAMVFHKCVYIYSRLADQYGLWDAAGIVKERGCSDEGFMDFRPWLIAQGKETYMAVLKDPDTITIQEVSLFPQGYAAVLTQTELLDEPSVIVADIGGWTVDLMRLDNRIPNAASCRSLELGMIRCIDEISEQVRRLFGLSMTTAQIESALRGSSGRMDERIRAVIHAQAGKYARNLLSAVTESGLDIRAMPTIFLGGGAALLKRHLSATDGLCRPLILDDVSLNAKGYERLVGQMSRGVGHGR